MLEIYLPICVFLVDSTRGYTRELRTLNRTAGFTLYKIQRKMQRRRRNMMVTLEEVTICHCTAAMAHHTDVGNCGHVLLTCLQDFPLLLLLLSCLLTSDPVTFPQCLYITSAFYVHIAFCRCKDVHKWTQETCGNYHGHMW